MKKKVAVGEMRLGVVVSGFPEAIFAKQSSGLEESHREPEE